MKEIVEKITCYVCDECGETYSSKKEAEYCEKRCTCKHKNRTITILTTFSDFINVKKVCEDCDVCLESFVLDIKKYQLFMKMLWNFCIEKLNLEDRTKELI